MKDTKKSSRLRRQRGYSFEKEVVEYFSDVSGWDSRRLGSPSTALPDVMAVNNFHKTIVALEAKSTGEKMAYVPFDQIDRCRKWVNMFSIYDRKIVVLAFKFKSFKDIHDRRKATFFFKIFPKSLKPQDVRCDYLGNIVLMRKDGDNEPITLEDYKIA